MWQELGINKRIARSIIIGMGEKAISFFIISLWMLMLFLPSCAIAFVQKDFSFDQVKQKARKLVEKPYDPNEGLIPKFLLNINYDAWRDIRFRPANALWKDENLLFNVQFFHPGLYFEHKVKINIISDKGVREAPFSTDLFVYGKKAAPLLRMIPKKLGFAGFRLHYPINTSANFDEVAVFLGASYFRAVAQHSNYGLSARGVAVDTWMSHGEQFTWFKEFWLKKPLPNDKEITLYALLDGESVCGAYQFVIKPGKDTVMDVKSTIFMRKKVALLGLAPITSMFFYGENTNSRPVDDFRPEVHDSDGLMLETATGEWVWRPLKNPKVLTSNVFAMNNLKGFGLFQRDRDFNDYQDLEAHSERRPSLWITPVTSWGDGSVELLQIPSVKEFDDNIVAFWVPKKHPELKQATSFDYTMHWFYTDDTRPPAGRVLATRISAGVNKFTQRFIIDFGGGKLDEIPADKKLTAVVSVDPRAKIVDQQLEKNEITKSWRLVFQVSVSNEEILQKITRGTEPAVEMRAFLKDAEQVLTETWSYAIQP